MYSVLPKKILSMFTRDGVQLDADVYYPDGDGEFPVLLMRQPYGRAIASTVVYAHPIWYAAHGYIVVIQDVRGRGSSGGEFDLFAHEIEDGYDTIHWAACLPNSDGQVGMYGFSYQGMTQLYAAAAKPPALKTICPSMIGYDLYQDWAYEGGAFCYQLNLLWALQLAAETARRQRDGEAYQVLYAAAHNPPIHDPVCARSGILEQLAPASFYHAWLNHPEPDEYWDKLSPKRYMQAVDMPMLHIGGWFDPYMRGTLHFYREMAAHSAFLQYLLVGPWAHLPWGRKVAAVDYGEAANSPVDRLQIRWFDQFLKGIDTGLLDEPPVQLFEMGSNQWRTFDRFPTGSQTSYVLSTTGLANMGDREGTLIPRVTFKRQNATPHTLGSPPPDILVHDPWRPAPALGGHATMSAGMGDRSSLDCRTDILTYTSEPLDEDVSLAGDITVELYCTADAASFDVSVVLSAVKSNSSVYPIAQGYRRVQTASTLTQPLRIPLQPTCIRLAKGNALRLSITAACFPSYTVNSGTGAFPHQAQLIDAQIITLTIYSMGVHGESTERRYSSQLLVTAIPDSPEADP
jgi:uncharacterized protein